MILKDLKTILDEIFDISAALKQDKTGLQTGWYENNVCNVLITLDITQEAVNEAINKKADLIISHHPLIFEPLKEITGDKNISRILLKLIENKIAVYVAHTNLDSMKGGINDALAEKIGLAGTSVLENTETRWYKFTVFVPEGEEDNIRNAIFKSGAGAWGDYCCCTFNLKGTGTFKPLEGASPHIGKVGDLSFVDETRIECVVSERDIKTLVKAVIAAHPYEEPAYDVKILENNFSNAGLGRIGKLKKPVVFEKYLNDLKSMLEVSGLRWAAVNPEKALKKVIKKAALINGSANSFSERLSMADFDCDVVIVGELKYNNVLDIIQGGKIIVEIGHGESEKLAMDLIHEKISKDLRLKKELKLFKSAKGFIPWRYSIE